MSELFPLLINHKKSFTPVLTILSHPEKLIKVDFSTKNQEIKCINIENVAVFAKYIQQLLIREGKEAAYGGYLERRDFYKRSKIFKSGLEIRDVHLGIDIWVKMPEPVFAPYDGVIHSFAINSGNGNYGGTIILQHEIEGRVFYTLYGHLSHASINGLTRGQKVVSGQQIGYLGEPHENGYWAPHLHFQIIKDMLNHEGDFPGTCTVSNVNYYRLICPDPSVILKLE
ncbi:MAG TPA: peptidoglycan DD-metalloendopeptidase family protein [Salinivirgaceae bacterium]|nr:peptidoglycan DD-metalloendopeptidase family protein [Salinivirgaceae bacterium]